MSWTMVANYALQELVKAACIEAPAKSGGKRT